MTDPETSTSTKTPDRTGSEAESSGNSSFTRGTESNPGIEGGIGPDFGLFPTHVPETGSPAILETPQGVAIPTVATSPSASGQMAPTDLPDRTAPKQSIRRLLRAANRGNSMAQYLLALAFYKGEGVPKDMERTVHWCRLSASAGYAVAQFRMGEFLRKGEGTKPDLAAALQWYQSAADAGDYKSQYRLAACIERGLGCAPNTTLAAAWYFKSAKQDYKKAQYRIGSLFLRGEGGLQRNPTQALIWFSKAAKKGHAASLFRLSQMYLTGTGVTANKKDAHELLRQSARLGHPRAAKILAGLREPRQIERANPRNTEVARQDIRRRRRERRVDRERSK